MTLLLWVIRYVWAHVAALMGNYLRWAHVAAIMGNYLRWAHVAAIMGNSLRLGSCRCYYG